MFVADCLAGGVSAKAAEERAKAFSGHSLRAGFATTTAAYGVTGENIARQTRHKSNADGAALRPRSRAVH
jgi:hypothetical protein